MYNVLCEYVANEGGSSLGNDGDLQAKKNV